MGLPQNDIGMRTDVLDACPKAKGIMMLIRSMSPSVIITDEIGRKEDVEALSEALNCGIKIIASVHANSMEQLFKRPILNSIMKSNMFDRILILGNSLGVGTIEKIYNKSCNIINTNPIR